MDPTADGSLEFHLIWGGDVLGTKHLPTTPCSQKTLTQYHPVHGRTLIGMGKR